MKKSGFIEQVSRAFLDTFSLDGGETEVLGKFLCRDSDEHWIAVNNEGGRRIRQDFQTKAAAIAWLRGNLCLNIRNELCDGEAGKILYDVAERVRAESERRR